MDEIICDVAANIHICEDPVIDRIEIEIANSLEDAHFNNDVAKIKRTINKIREKDIYITKADKSNNIVVQDKRAYDESVRALLDGGDYERLNRSPLNNIISEVKTTLKSLDNVFHGGRITTLNFLQVSNPKISKFYCLPKTHKPGNQVRPICSNVAHPTEKIAKWLVKEFTRLGMPSGFSVKNSLEFVDRMNNVTVKRNEEIVSFDVKSLFPSVKILKSKSG